MINVATNRPSLWPTEIDSNTISIPSDRQETRLPVTPVIRILEAGGRYGYGRRDRIGWNNSFYNYGAAMLALQGAVPQWQTLDTSLLSVDPATGIVWLPVGAMLWGYGQFRCRYIAGYIEIPYRIKLAMVTLINEVHAKGVSDRMKYTVGRVSSSYASETFISKQVQAMLQPFVVSEYQ